jgi:hypothetical protein
VSARHRHPSGELRLVASANAIGKYGGVQHLGYSSEDYTLCGRERGGAWMDMRAADLRTDLDSAWTCKRCVRAVVS